MSKLKGETHKSEAALTAVPFFFLLCRASVARRIHNSLTNDIRRGHNSHRQGDLYCAVTAAEDFSLLPLLPPGRRQRLGTTRLTRRIQCLDSRTISLFVRMVVALGHRHRLVAGEVVDLLYGDAEVEHSCDDAMVEVAV